MPISQWSPPELKHRFSRSFFKAISVRGLIISLVIGKSIIPMQTGRNHSLSIMANYRMSIIIMERTTTRRIIMRRSHMSHTRIIQRQLIHKQCIVLPLKKWQVIDNFGDVKYTSNRTITIVTRIASLSTFVNNRKYHVLTQVP